MRRHHVRGILATVLSGCLVVSLTTAGRATAVPTPAKVTPHGVQNIPSVGGRDAAPVRVAEPPADTAGLPEPKWPPATSADVAVSSTAARVKAGQTPVTLSSPTPGKVHLQVLDRTSATRAGVDGLVLKVRGAARQKMSVTVDYNAFKGAYGGDWSSRLRLVPESGAGVGAVHNDPRTGTLTADVAFDGTEQTFAVTAAPAGSTGDYKATSLAPSGKWQVSDQSGDFTWSYDLRVPPVPSGLTPDLAVSYDSQSVDGRTATSNNQPSWIGEGWDLGVGYIERSYKACADDLNGNNGTTKTGDLCWGTDNATMSLAGHSTPLVLENGTWRPKSDDGSRVEHLTDGTNGDNDHEYWRVTTTDGTQYVFGRTTDSAWTVPVFGNNAGEPCYQTTYDAAWCQQAYRWNLQSVTDAHGNTITYKYAPESNLYGRNLGKSAVSYVRGGTLVEADYGTRTGSTGQAPARVVFGTADRCLSNCTTHNASTWPDVPWDLSCTASPCTSKYSPTFWSTKTLNTVTTQVSTGGGGYRDVERWTMTHSFPSPGDGTTGALWLRDITHAGTAAGTVTLPAVVFGGTLKANRVNSAADGLPALYKERVTSIKNESGGEVDVTYSNPDCTPTSLPSAADTNTRLCFPVRWTMPPATTPANDWFHKYVVRQVVENDRTGSNLAMVTNYDYLGTPAWAYNDNPLQKPEDRTWNEWRGYSQVRVRQGDTVNDKNKPESATTYTYFRGMNGDKLTSGTRTAQIKDSTGTAIDDNEQLAGFLREQITTNGVGGPEVTGEIDTPYSRLTATQGTLRAYQVETAQKDSRTRLNDGTYRRTRTSSTYDEYGNETQTNDLADVTSPTDDRCTTTTYAKNTTTMLVNLPSSEKVVGVACGTTPTYPADAISETQTYYDNAALGTVSKGDVTTTKQAKSYDGSTPVFIDATTGTYDAYGRPLVARDALNRATTTAYTDVNGLTTSTSTTNALGHVTTSALDPAWGLVTTTSDPNGRQTARQYDGLGRLTSVWKPGRSQAHGDIADLHYTYTVRNTAPSFVQTDTLTAGGGTTTSYALLDGFLRARQTQAPSPAGGRIITDTLYDSRGLENVDRAAYYNSSVPGTALFLPDAGQIPSATVKVYDGAEREIASIYTHLNVEQWRTTTSYGGDHVDVVPPAGATPTTKYSDARGKTTKLLQYHSRSLTDAYDTTSYSYTKAGALASVTDPAGNSWRYEYDVLGRKVRSDDPDKGVATMTYDDAGQQLTLTDSRGKTTATVYDALGRVLETRLGSATGTLLTQRTYDTLAKGSPTSATRFVGGNAYVTSVAGYDAAGRPTGQTVSIPDAEGALKGSYTTTFTYASDGSPATTREPALGDLPGETVAFGYDKLGKLNTVAGAAHYVTETQYTALGEVGQIIRGDVGKRLWRTSYYDDGTRRLTETLTEREQPGGVMAHDMRYDYDPSGAVTKIGDQTGGSAADVQCFQYDYLQRVTSAWTATDDCAGAPSEATVGGPAPYWQTFGYDLTGNRTSSTDHGVGGAADVSSTLTYPAAGSPQPHTISKVTTGSRTSTYSWDPTGNLTSRPGTDGSQQTLTWNDDGTLDKVSSATGTTGYVYDADGNELLRHDSGSSTLYVGDGELRLDTATKALSGTRYYAGIGTRTAAGLVWTDADQHSTDTVAIDANTLTATTRRLDLFGDLRGPDWQYGTRGFVGGRTEDTGLVRLGAREYDPALGRFISTDPIIDPNDPQQLNGYAYSNNNPATMSDPTGLIGSCPDNDCRGHRGSNAKNLDQHHLDDVARTVIRQRRERETRSRETHDRKERDRRRPWGDQQKSLQYETETQTAAEQAREVARQRALHPRPEDLPGDPHEIWWFWLLKQGAGFGAKWGGRALCSESGPQVALACGYAAKFVVKKTFDYIWDVTHQSPREIAEGEERNRNHKDLLKYCGTYGGCPGR
ncbi:RHS repeat-associated core domain-containing protein [Kribbella karoonensis]|uniref:RHS repeat-associated core domain-containing protein n=1 Tax=Kribbella karoonensis TaxID=324851 RepID=A0ABN2CVN2_9ACTN